MRRLAFALALALAAAPALAQDSYRFELTPQAQFRWGGELAGENSAISDFDLDVNEGEAFGLTFDIPLSSNIQLELLASRQSTDLRFDEGIFGDDATVADIDIAYYHVGVLFQGGSREVVPFFVASAGATNLDPDVPGASSETRFSLSLGGGVKVFFTDNIGMRFEGRGFWTAIDSDGDSDCRHRCDWDDYGYDDLNQGTASVGLIFAW